MAERHVSPGLRRQRELAGKPLYERTVAELREAADRMGVAVEKDARKADIIRALRGPGVPAPSGPVEGETTEQEND